jgi:hypothetical protein
MKNTNGNTKINPAKNNGWKIDHRDLENMREEAIDIALKITGLDVIGSMNSRETRGTKGLASFVQDYLDTDYYTKTCGFMVIESKLPYKSIDDSESIYRLGYKDNEYFGINEEE